VSVPVYQFSRGGSAVQVPLTAIGEGPEAVSASIPGGQRVLGSLVRAQIVLLGHETATRRFEFNVHVTGSCGPGFVE
jgi:hypothetical protein